MANPEWDNYDPLSTEALADFGCGLCEWERRPVGTKHAELVRVKQCASCRLGSLRENAASSTGYEAVDAYRDAVLAAERQRLLALTPAATIEAAVDRAIEAGRDATRLSHTHSERTYLTAGLRAALPVLLAPEVARREQVEAKLAEQDAILARYRAIFAEAGIV